MGGGASVPEDMKQKIHTAFGLSSDADWATATDLKTEKELRDELSRLRNVALTCVNTKHEKNRIKDNIDLDASKKKKLIPKDKKTTDLLMACMKDNVLFKRCRPDEKVELVGNFEKKCFAAGATIIRQGDAGHEFYVVASGQCEALLNGNSLSVATQTAGMGFGELALMYNTPRAASIVAKTAVEVWEITRAEYRFVLATFAKTRSAAYVELLDAVELKSDAGATKMLRDCITGSQMTKLADCMDEDELSAGDCIINEGDDGHTFYVIARGEVEVFVKGEKIATLKAGGYFGHLALVKDEKRNATCKAGSGGCKVLAVDREDFVALLGSISDLVSEGSNVEQAVSTTSRVAAKITLADVVKVKTLGHGAFGKVSLCTVNGETYALKAQSKHAIVENNLHEHVLMERSILMSLDHPFILKLICSFQDESYIYFLLELLIGGELFTHLRKSGRFQEPVMKFFSAGVVLAFQHMHEKKIAYRDLKPENLVLDKHGYLKVVDLGLAKVVTSKTWTLCGTPDYLAPEVILNEGHDKAVDYWALGVLMYELVAGTPPFYADDPMEVYEKILSGNMSFPSHMSKYLNDIVRKLLKLCQSKRLGNGKGGCKAIKKHRFFSGFGWEDMTNYTLKAPIPIELKSDQDASNFDTYDETDDDALPQVDWNPELDE